MSDASLLVLCRAGFEGECAQEGQALADAAGVTTYARTERGSGHVEFPVEGNWANAARGFGHWRDHAFARTVLRGFACLRDQRRRHFIPVVFRAEKGSAHVVVRPVRMAHDTRL